MHASSPKKSSKRARREAGFGILVSVSGGNMANILDIYTDNNNDFLDTLAKLSKNSRTLVYTNEIPVGTHPSFDSWR